MIIPFDLLRPQLRMRRSSSSVFRIGKVDVGLYLSFFFILYLAETMDAVSSNQMLQQLPESSKPRLEVVGCFLTVGENVLFMKRQPYKSDGGFWGIPGGKLENGETAHQAVVREINEETGIDLSGKTLKYFGIVYTRLPDIDFIYHMYAYALDNIPKEIVFDPAEHTEYRWVTLQESLKLPLIRGGDECIYLVYGSEPKVSNETKGLLLNPDQP